MSCRSAQNAFISHTTKISRSANPSTQPRGNISLATSRPQAMGDSAPSKPEARLQSHVCCTCTTKTDRTPTPGSHSAQSSLASLQSFSRAGPRPLLVYIVTDTLYPTELAFGESRGTFNIDSVHSSRKAANTRAKKIIFEGSPSKVDVDKVIEEVNDDSGLYTAIGIGGKADGRAGNAYARKCGVESKIVDEDSEDEVEEEVSSSQEQREEDDGAEDRDVEMG